MTAWTVTVHRDCYSPPRLVQSTTTVTVQGWAPNVESSGSFRDEIGKSAEQLKHFGQLLGLNAANDDWAKTDGQNNGKKLGNIWENTEKYGSL